MRSESELFRDCDRNLKMLDALKEIRELIELKKDDLTKEMYEYLTQNVDRRISFAESEGWHLYAELDTMRYVAEGHPKVASYWQERL